MRLLFLACASVLVPALYSAPVYAQATGQAGGQQARQPTNRPLTRADSGAAVRFPADSSLTREAVATIKGQRVPYRVTVGNQPVWNEAGQPIATLFYTYYERTDVRDRATRPLVISFNGGPGSASVWMHVAYTGPKLLRIDSEGFPVQPYGVQDNPHSILDVADIVYVDPVNTGFSRIIGEQRREQFFGVNADIEYLARWVDAFVSRQERWASPKYLIGESYGTTRVSGLAYQLQNSHWMYLNGVVLVSPTGLGIQRSGPVGAALKLPYFAATAWYHRALAPDLQSRDLDQLLPAVERFTVDTLIPAMAQGGTLDSTRRAAVVRQFARYSGLKEEVVRQHALAIPTSFFWKELLRDRGLTVGRLDSRYRGLDREDAGQSPDFDPALTSWNHAFAPAINYYLRSELGWKTDLQYWLFGPVRPWNSDGDNTGNNLQQAMGANPYLHVMVQSGYFDGGTTYFDAKYTMWQMDPAGRFQDRMVHKGYRSGHMMYLRQEDLATSNEDIRQFIRSTIPANGAPARR